MTIAPAWHPATVSEDSVAQADRLAILNLLGVYFYYCNDVDIAGWAALFAEDAV
jgi:hypothetical protein